MHGGLSTITIVIETHPAGRTGPGVASIDMLDAPLFLEQVLSR
jgi:hypothetical protein